MNKRKIIFSPICDLALFSAPGFQPDATSVTLYIQSLLARISAPFTSNSASYMAQTSTQRAELLSLSLKLIYELQTRGVARNASLYHALFRLAGRTLEGRDPEALLSLFGRMKLGVFQLKDYTCTWSGFSHIFTLLDMRPIVHRSRKTDTRHYDGFARSAYGTPARLAVDRFGQHT